MTEVAYKPSLWAQEFHNLTTDEALGAGSAGPGKALSLDTPIPTPGGLVAMGDLLVGDFVFAEDGSPCRVTFATEVMYGRECFEVVFDDGAVIVADADHQWTTYSYRERVSLRNQEKRKTRTGLNDQRSKALQPKTRTTRQIADSLLDNGRVNHAVMCAKPFRGNDAALPIDPYILGLWLGDGCSTQATFYTADREVVDAFINAGYDVRKASDPYGWHARGMYRQLRTGSLLRNKHIPEQFQLASEDQRMSVLQGLVDTDGHIDLDGRVELTLCREALAKDAYRLVCGLGFKATMNASPATLNGREVGTRYRICWSPMGRQVCRLPRKVARIGTGSRTQRWRYIKDVRPVPSVPVRCIQVNSKSRLYLAGVQCVPTHNTFCLIHEMLPYIHIEHLRTLRLSQDELMGRYGFPEAKAKLIADNPLRPGSSVGWALFLRRQFTELEQVEKVMVRQYRTVDPGFEWSVGKKIGTFSSGLKIKLGHCANTGDWDQYLSDEYFMILYDELVTFDQEQYDQINTRNRCSDPVLGRMLKIRAMSNPYYKREGNTAAVKDPHWVRRRFVDEYRNGRKVLFEEHKHPTTGEIITKTRIYLPAKLTDNPSKDFQEAYMRTLIDKPAHIRAALIEGDWYIVADSFYGDSWVPRIHIRRPFRIPMDWKRARAMDWGFKTFGCILWGAFDYDDTLHVYKEYDFRLLTAREVAERAREIEKEMGCWDGKRSLLTGPADTQLWEERGDTGLTKAEEFAKVGLLWVPANKKSRIANAGHILKRLNSHEDGSKVPGLVVHDCCEKLIQTLPLIQPDPNSPEEPQKGGEDHPADCLGYFCSYASRGSSGISMYRASPSRDDEDDDDGPAPARRGRYGYGEGY
jgi:hypothetical protein